MRNRTRPHIPKSALWAIPGGIILVAAVVGVAWRFDVEQQILQALHWLDAQGAWAPVLFMVIMAAVVVLVLPGMPFTMGAGFVFGVVKGTVCVVVGTTIGAALAFLIARHLFGQRAKDYLRNHPKMRLVNDELAHEDWKIVLLTRMVPLFPFKLSNYFFGLTAFSLRGFAVGTLIGIIPFSLNSVYIGSIAADIATLGTRTAERTPLQWALYGAGFVVAVGAFIYITREARKALAKYTEKDKGTA